VTTGGMIQILRFAVVEAVNKRTCRNVSLIRKPVETYFKQAN